MLKSDCSYDIKNISLLTVLVVCLCTKRNWSKPKKLVTGIITFKCRLHNESEVLVQHTIFQVHFVAPSLIYRLVFPIEIAYANGRIQHKLWTFTKISTHQQRFVVQYGLWNTTKTKLRILLAQLNWGNKLHNRLLLFIAVFPVEWNTQLKVRQRQPLITSELQRRANPQTANNKM